MGKFFFAVTAILLGTASHAQSLDSTLAQYAADYQPEKVYLHYDKSSYYAGETIWFKAYLMEGLFPAEKSRTLYVDWITDNGTVLSHMVSPIVDAGTNGQFEVPADYAGDLIHVRAYTKWMLNFDTAFLYSRDIRILPKDPAGAKIQTAIIPSIQFFPEGGDLIAGVKNNIAFKANDQFGRPVAVKAKLFDARSSLVAGFTSLHDGMGSFSFVPQEGAAYTVKWTDEKKLEHTALLPPARAQGVSMQVALEGTQRIITLNGSRQLPDNLKRLHFIGTINQVVAFKNDVAMEDGQVVRRIIPTEVLPTGVLTITLFDADWNAIAERISFINNHESTFEPSLEVLRWGLGRRKRDEIEIRLPDSMQSANLSVSVTDAAIEKDTTGTIVSHFLLTSEIRGRVNNPAYYFQNNSDSIARQLDLVMLTNGWRRFKWEDVRKGILPRIVYPRDTSYLTLSGQIFGVTKSQLSGRESIALLVKEKDTSTKMIIMPINTDGRFSDPELVFFDTLKVYYSLKSKFLKLAEAKFMTDRLPAPNYTSFSRNFINSDRILDTTGTYHHSLLASKSLELLNIQRGNVMKTVIVQTTKKSPLKELDEKYATGMFQGGDGNQFDLMNDPSSFSYTNVLNYLQGKVAGLQITTGDEPSLSWRGGAPQIYLDETATDVSMITNVPVSDIAYVKVFRPPFMGGFNGANGAIAIYTKKGGDRPSGQGLSANTIAGYTPIRQFYSPNYDVEDARNDRLDIRTTLYWNPLLTSLSQNKHSIRFSFYNNDVTKSFRVVIEGMSADGLLTHYEQIIE
jgi:hypothetical protein